MLKRARNELAFDFVGVILVGVGQKSLDVVMKLQELVELRVQGLSVTMLGCWKKSVIAQHRHRMPASRCARPGLVAIRRLGHLQMLQFPVCLPCPTNVKGSLR